MNLISNKVEKFRQTKANKPWPIRLINGTPMLSKWIQLLNSKVLPRMGIKVVSADAKLIPANWFVINHVWLDKLFCFQRLLNLVEGIQGDVVECGVASGNTLVALASLVKNSKTKRHIWGFDSFKGLPPPSKEDLSSPKSIAKKGAFSEANEETVFYNLKSGGINEDFIKEHITLAKGWFHETLPNYNGQPIALLHVDVDLYDSCRITLENLWPEVAIGGIAIFDEYHRAEEWPGEKRAADEYFSQRPQSMHMHQDSVSHRYYAIKLR